MTKGNYMQQEHFSIRGMSCEHCVMTVRRALSRLDSVIVDSVEIGSADIRYDEKITDRNEIVRAIKEAGYEIVPAP
jgi:copper chaperone CopZ